MVTFIGYALFSIKYFIITSIKIIAQLKLFFYFAKKVRKSFLFLKI